MCQSRLHEPAESIPQNMKHEIRRTKQIQIPTLSISADSSGQIALSFLATRNQTYQIQAADALENHQWTTIFTYSPATTNSIVSTTDNTTNRQRFYRLAIGP